MDSRLVSSKVFAVSSRTGSGWSFFSGFSSFSFSWYVTSALALSLVAVVDLHGLLGVATLPLDQAERIERGIDRTLEDRLGQVVPVETHGVADVHGGELARQRGERDVEVDAKERSPS